MAQAFGDFLRETRLRLGLGLRDVQQASSVIAGEENNMEFYISAARLSQIESEGSPPSVFKIFSLCAVYGLDFIETLDRYGINADRVYHYRNRIGSPATHLLSAEVHNVETKVKFPVRLNPGFRRETTQVLNQVIALWGEIPAAFLQELNPRCHIYGYIGLKDWTMYPILRPGAVVMIDGNLREVQRSGWTNEAERPIYFVELSEGYLCGWCQLDEDRLTVIPHPMSLAAAACFGFPDEAEILGQVVGVAMRIVPTGPATPGVAQIRREQSAFER